MMICPDEYVRLFIEGKTPEQIRKEIDKLIRRNRAIKRILQGTDDIAKSILIHPKTQISMNLEYIKAASDYLFKLTGEIYPPKKDERSIFARWKDTDVEFSSDDEIKS